MSQLMKDLLNPVKMKTNCKVHGDYEARVFMGNIGRCPTCSEEENKANEAYKAAQHEEYMRLRRLNWLRDCGVGERYLDATLQTFVTDERSKNAYQAAVLYAEAIKANALNGKGLIFTGKPGTGKTHLAIGILREAVEAGLKPLLITAIQAIRKVKETWSKDSETAESQMIEYFIRQDLLILDEVGIQFGSDTEKMILFEILNGRYERRKPTIFISNLSANEVKGFLGERVFDRLREDGGEVVIFDWPSHRGNASQ